MTHDHEILIGAALFRGTLIRDDEGRAMYSVADYVPNYNPFLTFEQTNWVDGHGHDLFRDPDGYFEGQSIDTTQEGRVILGPKIFEVKEDDDTDLDSAPVCFLWYSNTGEWLVATSGKIYRYIADDTGIDTNEALTATETGIDCDADASTPIPVNSVVHIESEQMFVSATGTTLTVVRGFNGTTAATHVTDTDIYIYKWTPATDTVAGVTHMIEFDGVAYAAVGAGTKYYYSTNGDDWTQSGLDYSYAVKFFVAPNPAGTATVLWAFKTPNELRNTTDGTSVEWTNPPAYIGDTSNNITNIFMASDELLIGREDNLFYYDSEGGQHPYMDDLKLARSSRNFKYVTSWQSAVYFSLIDSLGEISAEATFEPVGPLQDIPDVNKVGFCTGLTSDTNYLYAAIDEGTNIHIYKGRETRTARGLKWQWCPWVFLGAEACATITVCQHSTGDKRCWFGYGNSTAYVTITDNPTADSDARFAASGWLRMSYTYGTNQYWDKLFNRLITETKGCSANETVTPKYRKDTDTGATALTAAVTTNGVVETDFTSLVACKKIQFEVHLATGDSTTTPEVLMFRAVGVEKPEATRVHECTYAIGDSPSDRTETLRSALRVARTSVALIRFADLRFGEAVGGTYAYVICQPGYPIEVEVMHEKGRAPEMGMRVRWEEVGETIVDDFGYYYNQIEDIFQDIYNDANELSIST